MERNVTLDYFKIFLSILVITIHYKVIEKTSFDIFYNNIISDGIARIAVPCFFMISGYFLKIDNFSKVKKYTIHLGILYITWGLFYLPNFKFSNIYDFLIGLLFGFNHLWYLPALIGAVISFYIINKFIKNSAPLLIIAAILFIICYILQLKLEESIFKLLKYRNFLFLGLPFLIIGNLIKTILPQITKKVSTYLVFICTI